MSTSILHLCRGAARSAESFSDELAALRQDGDDTLRSDELSEWVALCIRFGEGALRRDEQARHAAFSGRVRDFDGFGKVVLRLFDTTLALCRTVRDTVADVNALSLAPSVTKDIEGVLTRLETARADFVKFWPWPDPQRWERSRQEIEAGRCHNVQEVLRGLRDRRARRDPATDDGPRGGPRP